MGGPSPPPKKNKKGGTAFGRPPPLGSHFLALLDGIFILAPQPHGVPAQLHGIPAQLHGGDGGPNSSKKGDKRLYIHICMDENIFFLTKNLIC